MKVNEAETKEYIRQYLFELWDREGYGKSERAHTISVGASEMFGLDWVEQTELAYKATKEPLQ